MCTRARTKTSAKITTDLIEIEPKIIYDTQNKEMSVEFKLGNGKNSYKIKNLITSYKMIRKWQK